MYARDMPQPETHSARGSLRARAPWDNKGAPDNGEDAAKARDDVLPGITGLARHILSYVGKLRPREVLKEIHSPICSFK